jgi:glycosyltransferase involved in cell wall biosynthesis
LRIALLTPAWPGQNTPNGIATTVTYLREGLEACGHEVTIIAGQIDAPHEDDRVIVLPDERWSLLDKLRWRLGDEAVMHRLIARRIAGAVREAERRFGVGVFVMEETYGWAHWLRGEIAMPVVVMLHGPWVLHKTWNVGEDPVADERREAREALALRVVQGITAPSCNVLDATREAYGFPEVPQVVVPNPIPIGSQVRLGVADSVRLEKLLFVGRYDRHKGGDTVIEAFRHLAAQVPGCALSFVGPDHGIALPDGSMQGLDAHLATLPKPIRQRITVMGLRSKTNIAALRQSHGITLIASRYETFGYALVEAMAVGSPIICTRVGGPAEILRHEETALLVPPDDPAAMAKACARLIDNPELAIQLGHAARDHVLRYLTPEAAGRQLAEFLERVVRYDHSRH